MTLAISQTFVPGPRLIDGSDLSQLVTQANTAFGLLGQIQQVANVAVSTIGAATLTAASITTGLITRSGSTAAFTDTTDTATAIVAAITGAVIGQSFYLTIKNTTAFAETIAGGSGVTVSGISIIPGLSAVRFLVVLTSLTAVSVIGVGGEAIVPLPVSQITTEGTGSSTIAAAGLGGAQTCVVLFTSATAHTTQALPPPAQIIAAIPNAQLGLSYNLVLRNNAAATVHLVTLGSTHLSALTTLLQTGITATAVVTLNTATDITITGTGKSAG